jgi:HipA-like protein
MSFSKLLRTLRGKTVGKPASFTLRYVPPGSEDFTVGHLEFKDGVWTFRYDDEYKGRHDFHHIEGFEDVNKVYQSAVLFPFFAVRIPDTQRADVKRKLEREHLKNPQATDLLRIFGRRVLSSPAFELLPEQAA